MLPIRATHEVCLVDRARSPFNCTFMCARRFHTRHHYNTHTHTHTHTHTYDPRYSCAASKHDSYSHLQLDVQYDDSKMRWLVHGDMGCPGACQLHSTARSSEPSHFVFTSTPFQSLVAHQRTSCPLNRPPPLSLSLSLSLSPTIHFLCHTVIADICACARLHSSVCFLSFCLLICFVVCACLGAYWMHVLPPDADSFWGTVLVDNKNDAVVWGKVQDIRSLVRGAQHQHHML
jgi:hypothetical protein